MVSSGPTGVTYSLSNAIDASTPSVEVTLPIAVTLPDKVTTQPGLLVGLTDGSVYFWNGNACSSSATTCGWNSSPGAAVNGSGVTVVPGWIPR